MHTLPSHTDTTDGDELSARVSNLGSPAMSVVQPPAVQIVIPVYNEQRVLRASVRRLHDYLTQQFNFTFEITIADNASTDATPRIARALARAIPEVGVLRLERKGRGRALRAAWSRSAADVVAYMDVDLSTDLAALPELLIPLLEKRADVAIGSRLAAGAQVTRGIKRELISRSYNLLLRALLHAGFSDAQCGFKAARREVAQVLLAEVEDEDWFFDTELLYRAEQRGLAIHEVPVRWVDDPDSRVAIVATARADLEGIGRLRADRATREADVQGELFTDRYARPRNDYDSALSPFRARPVAGLPGLLGLAGAAGTRSTSRGSRDELGYHRYWVAEHHGGPMLAGPSPEALIGPIAAATSRIRVGSGGVMLPHYSPFKVAETFSLLAGLFPGRIDLALGRAAGTDPLTTFALQRDRRQAAPDDFPAAARRAARLPRGRPPRRAPLRASGADAARATRAARAVAAGLLAAERDLGGRAGAALRVRGLHQPARARRSPRSTASASPNTNTRAHRRRSRSACG